MWNIRYVLGSFGLMAGSVGGEDVPIMERGTIPAPVPLLALRGRAIPVPAWMAMSIPAPAPRSSSGAEAPCPGMPPVLPPPIWPNLCGSTGCVVAGAWVGARLRWR